MSNSISGSKIIKKVTLFSWIRLNIKRIIQQHNHPNKASPLLKSVTETPYSTVNPA